MSESENKYDFSDGAEVEETLKERGEKDFSEYSLDELKQQYKDTEQELHIASEIDQARSTQEQINDVQKRLQHLDAAIQKRKDMEINARTQDLGDMVH